MMKAAEADTDSTARLQKLDAEPTVRMKKHTGTVRLHKPRKP
jgi:hypothetical protein